jgi:hypothetical protein
MGVMGDAFLRQVDAFVAQHEIQVVRLRRGNARTRWLPNTVPAFTSFSCMSSTA